MPSPAPDTTDGSDRSDPPGTTASGPFRVEWTVSRVDDTTLVTVRVTNACSHARVVHIGNRLDGPVLPPRRNGVAEACWDADGCARSVPAASTIAVGYACRAPPREPPVTVSDRTGEEPTETPVEHALRSLGDHAPPRAAVTPDAPPSTAPESGGSDDSGGSGDSADAAPTDIPDSPLDDPNSSMRAPDPDADRTATGADGRDAGRDQSPSPADAPTRTPSCRCDSTVPRTVGSWFDAVEARLDTVDRLGEPVETATPLLAALGGHRGVETLAETLAADVRALRAVADRAETLADRVDACTVPDLGESP